MSAFENEKVSDLLILNLASTPGYINTSKTSLSLSAMQKLSSFLRPKIIAT
jgi:hypothetical protein